jgi:phosphoserine phosphatase
VVGVGDSYNDLPLLSTADVSYTFHASPAEVRDTATHVVTDLAEAIYHFMG